MNCLLLSPKDERNILANPSPDAATIGPSMDAADYPGASNESADLSIIHPLSACGSHQRVSYGGYGNSTGSWDGYPHFVNADGLHLSPVIYNENQSLLLHAGYGFTPEMSYGQYSPVGTPLPSLLVEGPLYASQQVPFPPTYCPLPASPNVPAAVPVIPTELMTLESSKENMHYGTRSGYLIQYGSYGMGNISGIFGSSAVTSPAAYSQPVGILGSYERRQRSGSSVGHYPHDGSYQSSKFSSASVPFLGPNDQTRFVLDKGKRQERDQDSICISNESQGMDHNRGPRAVKLKGKSTSEQSSRSDNSKIDSAISAIDLDLYNQPDFCTDYENARFFIIKSFSEDNVHKSIKYNVWASTPHGNKKLDAAYCEAKEKKETCPVFLLFSVNASGQFCGVAQMAGPVDFESDADFWQQDRWSGQFPVQWHVIKDVPNNRFRHILLQNNDNKPVTHSRDSQEVNLEQGIEMLKIFKDHDTRTSILDDFVFYDKRERALKERKAREPAFSPVDASYLGAGDSVNQMSHALAQTIRLKEEREGPSREMGCSSGTDALASLANESISQNSDFILVLQLEDKLSSKEVSVVDNGIDHQNSAC
ncbi:YTH domain-containing family protein 2 isoform X2 [Herrania umbratica]|uniref:YTH domain-containing family protein n=1 Tax=Herrania umbratica TaxID=108875 RepID=A0A6J0ZVG3_9ROSI|nr:YTH domain-containing family protein 2 isoform X2 [Herrania umbratica]